MEVQGSSLVKFRMLHRDRLSDHGGLQMLRNSTILRIKSYYNIHIYIDTVYIEYNIV